MKILNLSFNNIKCKNLKKFSENLEYLYDLKELYLNNNKNGVNGAMYIAKALYQIISLRILDLSENSIRSQGMMVLAESFEALENLVELSVKNNKIDHEGIAALAKKLSCVPKLNVINISENNIHNFGAKILAENLQYLQDLIYFNISYCEIEEEGIEFIASSFEGIKNIEILNISHNYCGSKGAQALAENIGELENLKTVYFTGCMLSHYDSEGYENLIEELKKIKSLVNIFMQKNKITDDKAICSMLKSLKNIKHFNMCFNPTDLSEFSKNLENFSESLRGLHLTNLNLSEESVYQLGRNISKLKKLIYLELKHSQKPEILKKKFAHIKTLTTQKVFNPNFNKYIQTSDCERFKFPKSFAHQYL